MNTKKSWKRQLMGCTCSRMSGHQRCIAGRRRGKSTLSTHPRWQLPGSMHSPDIFVTFDCVCCTVTPQEEPNFINLLCTRYMSKSSSIVSPVRSSQTPAIPRRAALNILNFLRFKLQNILLCKWHGDFNLDNFVVSTRQRNPKVVNLHTSRQRSQ